MIEGEMLALAARCEHAQPDRGHWLREIDLDIVRAIDRENPACRFGEQDSSGIFTVWEWSHGGVTYTRGQSWGALPVPFFTASLDAAMSLVPEPGKWSITAGHGGDWQACVWLVEGLELNWQSAATPALALCAAALRARATEESPHV